MADKVIIRFSSDKLTIRKKDLDKEIDNKVQSTFIAMASGQAQITPEARDKITEDSIRQAARDQMLSLRDNEKIALEMIIEGATKKTKTIGEYNILLDLAGQIENSDDHIIISKSAWEKIRGGFEKIEPKDRPVWWLYCGELFKQLEKPNDIEDKEVEALRKKRKK